MTFSRSIAWHPPERAWSRNHTWTTTAGSGRRHRSPPVEASDGRDIPAMHSSPVRHQKTHDTTMKMTSTIITWSVPLLSGINLLFDHFGTFWFYGLSLSVSFWFFCSFISLFGNFGSLRRPSWLPARQFLSGIPLALPQRLRPCLPNAHVRVHRFSQWSVAAAERNTLWC